MNGSEETSDTMFGRLTTPEKVLKLVYVLGIPGFLCIVVIGFLLLKYDALIISTNDMLKLHVISTERVVDQNDDMKLILQQICSNISETNQERQGCFQ